MNKRVGKQEKRQYVSVLTGGWRFTLPMQVRRLHGWHEGLALAAFAAADSSMIVAKPGQREAAGLQAECYLGSGGKIVVPGGLREALGWAVGQRFAISAEDGAVLVAPCCSQRNCRSCGTVEGTREVIPGLYLCGTCWREYVRMLDISPRAV